MALRRFQPPGEHSYSDLSGADLIETLIQRAHGFLFAYSPTLRTLVSWSDNAPEILGVKDVVIARDGNLFLRHVHPDDRYDLMKALEVGLRGEAPYRVTYRWIRPDKNETRWLHCRAELVAPENGNVALFQGLVLDLTEEISERTMPGGAPSLPAVLQAIPGNLILLDRDLRIVLTHLESTAVFPLGEELLQAEDLCTGRELIEYLPNTANREQYRTILSEMLEQRLPHYRERIATKKGLLDEAAYELKINPVVMQARVVGILLSAKNLTDQRALEEKIAQLQRNEGEIQIAASVAHNFNNALQSILGQATVLRNHPEDQTLVRKAGQSILDIVEESSDLARQLMSFGRHDTPLTTFDLNIAVMSAIHQFPELFSAGIKVTVAFGSPGKIRADQHTFSELIGAIVRFAWDDAQKNTQPLVLSIATAPLTIEEGGSTLLPHGKYAELSIKSTLPHDTLISTNGTHESATHALISPTIVALRTRAKQSNGVLEVHSNGDGTIKIGLYLPSVDSVASVAKVTNETPLYAPKVLVIDDDRMVLETIEAMLNDFGIPVVGTNNAQAALKILRQSPSIQTVLIDAVMPGADSATLVRELQIQTPTLVVIGFSGATAEFTTPLLNAGAVEILSKPVSAETLLKTLAKHGVHASVIPSRSAVL